MINIDLFHFLRPLALLAIPAVVLIWWLVRRQETQKSGVADLVAPHLRDALTVNRGQAGRFRPVDGAAIVMLAAAVAAAGPTWSKQQSPWFSETRSGALQGHRSDQAAHRVAHGVDCVCGQRAHRNAAQHRFRRHQAVS